MNGRRGEPLKRRLLASLSVLPWLVPTLVAGLVSLSLEGEWGPPPGGSLLWPILLVFASVPAAAVSAHRLAEWGSEQSREVVGRRIAICVVPAAAAFSIALLLSPGLDWRWLVILVMATFTVVPAITLSLVRRVAN